MDPVFTATWQRMPSEVASEDIDQISRSKLPTCMREDKAFFDKVFKEEIERGQEHRDDTESLTTVNEDRCSPIEPVQFYPGSIRGDKTAMIASTTEDLSISSPAPVDLMQVSITIYDITGITLIHKKKKKKRVFKRASTNKGDIKVEQQGGPPTTAVISCSRRTTKSSVPIATYLPSLPMDVKESRTMTAYWPGVQSQLLTGMDELVPSTFKLIRPMKRVSFTKAHNLTQVSNYEHETIDLNLSIGQGKNLELIGSASFVVTGEEETEVLHNILVRPISFEKRVKTGKKIVVQTCAGPKRFAVGETSILRVGVRLLPEQDIREATRRIAQAESSNKKSLQNILDTMMSDHYVVNENSAEQLLQNIIENQLKRLEEERAQRKREMNTDEVHQSIKPHTDPEEGSILDFFIGMFDMCSPRLPETAPTHAASATWKPQVVATGVASDENGRKMPNMAMTPELSSVSSVSGSDGNFAMTPVPQRYSSF